MLFSEIPQKKIRNFSFYFESLKDPRRTQKGNHLYPLDEILFLSIAGVVSGADCWTTIELFGKNRLSWLREFFPFKHGIPSHDVLGRVFSALDPTTFNTCFRDWIDSLSSLTKGEVIALDGKTICNSNDKNSSKNALHVVSAFAVSNKICLGQVAVDEKSNEITAIPALLNLLFVKDCVVTIDAMGCQKSIVKTILEKEANYILMVKKNQKELFEQIEKNFTKLSPSSKHDWRDLGHGRIETRYCRVINDLRFLDAQENWLGLKSIICIDSERIDKSTGKTTHASRYYISSLLYDAQQFNQAIRSHWAIENNLHWSLDVVFKEDDSLKKKGNSALNFNMLTKIALTLLDQEKSTKNSKPAKRLKCALDDKFRNKVLKI